MSKTDQPEPGERCKVQLSDGETIAVWTGHMWAADNGQRILSEAEIQSWEVAPSEGELKVIRPDEDD